MTMFHRDDTLEIGSKSYDQLAIQMWGFDEDDSFVPMTFGSAPLSFLFEPDASEEAPPDFSFQRSPSHPGRPVVSSRDPQSLVDENNQLRQTEISMRETYAERVSQNARLKKQLEECRTRFMNALRSGITTPNHS
jgi:hypothetical protein